MYALLDRSPLRSYQSRMPALTRIEAADHILRGYSLQARTGWPAGWKYDPQIGRIP
jgi:hypothetical protein